MISRMLLVCLISEKSCKDCGVFASIRVGKLSFIKNGFLCPRVYSQAYLLPEAKKWALKIINSIDDASATLRHCSGYVQ